MMFRITRLRNRLILWVIGGVLAVLAVVTLATTILVRNALAGEVQDRVLNYTQTKVKAVDGFFRELGTIPIVLASASAVDRENDEMVLRDRIRKTLENNPAVYGSTVAFEPYTFYADQEYFSPYYSRTADWNDFNYVQLGSDDYVYFRDWEWYTGPRASGKLYWTLPYFDEGAGNIWMVTASYPVIREGEFTGVATMDVPIEDVKKSLEELRVGELGYALMFDRSGGIVAVSGIPGLLDGQSIEIWQAAAASPEVTAVLEAALSGEEGVAEVPDVIGDSGEMWAFYAMIPSTGWRVVTFISVAEMLKPVGTVSWGIGAISLLGLGILVGIVFFVSNRITRPIEKLRAEALSIAQGDFARRVPVEGHDEIAAMSQAFNTMANELDSVIAGLEKRVAERTRGLRAAAEVSRTTTAVLDMNTLLPQVVNLIRERFDLYYVGLFLVDEAQEFAVLRAGTGAAGREMLAHEHRLKVGGNSMIGLCVSRDQARIASDVGEEAVRFNNPWLPETHSEMALPLRARGQVIGALTVQSTNKSAFDESDIAVIQTMADQVAVAIDNARLFAESQATVDDLEAAQRRYLGQAWKQYLVQAKLANYEVARTGLAPLGDVVLPEVLTALERRDVTVLQEGEQGHSSLVAPVLLRGEVIGALGFHDETRRQWGEEEIALVKAVAEQMSLAAENLRLLDQTQRRATREQIVGQITSRIRESLDLDTVLQTAVREIGEALGAHDLAIELETDEQEHLS